MVYSLRSADRGWRSVSECWIHVRRISLMARTCFALCRKLENGFTVLSKKRTLRNSSRLPIYLEYRSPAFPFPHQPLVPYTSISITDNTTNLTGSLLKHHSQTAIGNIQPHIYIYVYLRISISDVAQSPTAAAPTT